MLDIETRTAIFQLHRVGNGTKKIARSLQISRTTVKRVLASGQPQPPRQQTQARHELDPKQVRALLHECRGNLVRVHEKLGDLKVHLPYSSLTRFCRQHGIGGKPKRRAGSYTFEPGEEMQHDTSPHTIVVGGRRRKLQCASLVLCYSRMRFAQVYPTFNRFYAKAFLNQALSYFSGAAARCMIDNTSVIVANGSGKNATIAPEMEAFGLRFDFVFTAHRIGDANRSARVEREFHHIENNFYPGRTFETIEDLNTQIIAWCDVKNAAVRRHLKASSVELFAAEANALRPLPAFVPEVYRLHHRMVDLRGYITLFANRYSVPEAFIGRRVEVVETLEQVRVVANSKRVAIHTRIQEGLGKRLTLPEHRHPSAIKRTKARLNAPIPEEAVLKAAAPELAEFVAALRKARSGRASRPIKRLHRFFLDYPTDALIKAICIANEFGLTDLDRIEGLVLKHIAGDFFRLPFQISNAHRGDSTPHDHRGDDG